MDTEHIADALAGFRGVARHIEVGDIYGRIFLNNASFGLYADIIDNRNYRELSWAQLEKSCKHYPKVPNRHMTCNLLMMIAIMNELCKFWRE